MNFAIEFNALFHVLADFLVLVASYLGLALFIITCIVIAEFSVDHAEVIREYGTKPTGAHARDFREVGRDARSSRHRL